MQYSKENIEQELAHKQELLEAYKNRLRPRELQAARRGDDAQPEILTEISKLKTQISNVEEEISKLRTLSAQGHITLVDAEYRVLLAEVWNTPIGRPTAEGASRLELARLKLGLQPDRALELEREVRINLVEEIFMHIDIMPIFDDFKPNHMANLPVHLHISTGDEGKIDVSHIEIHQFVSMSDPEVSTLRLIGKAIRLEPMLALRLFIENLSLHQSPLNLGSFQERLFRENRVWINQEEKTEFQHFIEGLNPTIIEGQSEDF